MVFSSAGAKPERFVRCQSYSVPIKEIIRYILK